MYRDLAFLIFGGIFALMGEHLYISSELQAIEKSKGDILNIQLENVELKTELEGLRRIRAE